MRYVMEVASLGLKEPCDECGAAMKCYDGCRKHLHKQKHTVQAPIQDSWKGLDEDNSWFKDEMEFPPLNTFAQIYAFQLYLCNNDKQMAQMLAKQQLAAQNQEKEMEKVAQQDVDEGWATVPSKKRKNKRGSGNWVR